MLEETIFEEAILKELKDEWNALMEWNPEGLDNEAILMKYPTLTAVMVEYSAGYLRPLTAARAIADAAYGRPNYCEWYMDQQGNALRRGERKSMLEITRANLAHATKRAATSMDRPFYRNQLKQALTWVKQEAKDIERRNSLTPALQAA